MLTLINTLCIIALAVLVLNCNHSCALIAKDIKAMDLSQSCLFKEIKRIGRMVDKGGKKGIDDPFQTL